jgi:hypothetical protein
MDYLWSKASFFNIQNPRKRLRLFRFKKEISTATNNKIELIQSGIICNNPKICKRKAKRKSNG